jgi:phosphoribosylaminoimidazolecarboxamide formyltransferase/IMP cyclohydrolase
MRKRALLSVTDKDGILDLARALIQSNFEIIATGGTFATLKAHGIDAVEIGEITGVGELAGGRVKSLHPTIFAGILATGKERENLGFAPIDIVVVNLYRLSRSTAKIDVESIDVGGVALIRAAAKNFTDLTLLTSPSQYQELIDALPMGVDENRRRELAAIGFAVTARYDLAIAESISQERSKGSLRYGENPHQSATLLSDGSSVAGGRIVSLGSKEISYNNYLDMDAAWRAVNDHPADQPVVAIVKHSNPCGIALGSSARAAFRKALESDPASSFGGVVAINRTVDADLAKDLAEIFLEVIIAPSFSEEATTILSRRSTLRLVEVAPEGEVFSGAFISGGILVQERDSIIDESSDDWDLVCGVAVSDSVLADLRFAWRSVRSVKSNAIVIAKDGATVGIGMGQVSRVDAARLAVQRGGDRVQGSVAASDAFFPFADGAMELVNAGVVAIVQPGGSKRDTEVIEAVSQAGITMYFTHRRHFSH